MFENWSDQTIEEVIGTLLRLGVLASAIIVLTGGVIYLARHGHSPASYRVFQGEPNDLRELRGIMRAAAHGSGRGIIQLGLILLIATPVARVAFSLFAFAVERDWLYVGVTLIVLLLLLYSLAGTPW